MKRFLPTLIAAMLAAAMLDAPAQAAFGLEDLDVTFTEPGGGVAMQAGTHPFAFTTTVNFATKDGGEIGFEVPDGSPRELTITAPPGLAGTPTATSRCENADFFAFGGSKCSLATQVGITDVSYGEPTNTERFVVYNLIPPPGVAAKLGFIVNSVPVTVEAGVNPNPPYNILAKLSNVANLQPVYGSRTTIWGYPADPLHDPERQGCAGNCSAGLAKVPFLTAPRACEGPLPTTFEATSWEEPQNLVKEETLTHDDSVPPQPRGFGECAKLGFSPELTAQSTSRAASSPTGIDVEMTIEDPGVLNPSGAADSDLKRALVTLPEGMTANPSLAEGLATCSPAQYAAEDVDSEPGVEGCPEASKVGTVEVETPLLQDELLRGQLFIASQNDNPFRSLLALYMVIKDRDLGVVVKLAGRVTPDLQTGQLTTTFGEPGHELPQFPLSRVNVHLREGGRSPLISPPTCGVHETKAVLTPWANPDNPLHTTATFEITEGPNGGDCPSGGTPPFQPGFGAGTLNNDAGSHSPFHMRLTRRDGDQDLTKFSATLPPGVVAKLAGTTQCSDAAIASAKAKTGKEEQSSPSCPSTSQIGSVMGGAGAGSQLTYVPGQIYLAGPYKGAPLSVVAIVPAVAGPFDVGNVVVQQALRIDPRTAKVRADGDSSDPLPHILAGIPLAVRDVQVAVDKPSFTLNPTSCEPFQTAADIWGGGLDAFSAIDDSPVARNARFQAANCASLGFKPRLDLKLKGGTKRGGHPALKGTYVPRPGDANLKGLVLRLPRSAFLDQAHIRTICTRVQFAAESCPEGAIYGQATAFTPLLSEPLKGPVYLRSSDNNLPDFVADLKGLVDVEAVARIDSVKGGIRATFEDVPDAPISKVLVQMQGAKKGLIVNSTDLCAAKHRAKGQLSGHNGRRASLKPVVRAGCGGKRSRGSATR